MNEVHAKSAEAGVTANGIWIPPTADGNSPPGDEVPTTHPRSPWSFLDSIAGPVYRDFWNSRRALLIPALAYVAGLAVWSWNATRNHLGTRVGVDPQYLLAGVIPAILLLVGLALAIFIVALPSWSRSKLEGSGRAPAFRRGIGVLLVLGVLSFLFLTYLPLFGFYPPFWPLYLVMALSVVTFFAFVCLPGGGPRLMILYATVYVIFGVAALIGLSIFFYANTAYPWLPQALGGGATRCAMLDIQTNLVSKRTLSALATRTKRKQVQGTIHTDEVDIIYENGGDYFLRPKAGGETLELRGDVVRAVVGCPSQPGKPVPLVPSWMGSLRR